MRDGTRQVPQRGDRGGAGPERSAAVSVRRGQDRDGQDFGNVGSLASFQVGSDDAETLALQFSKHAGQLRPQDLANLPKYTGYARILVKGLPTAPFSIRTLPPVEPVADRRAVVRDASRRQFAQPITVVRQHLQREMALAYD